MPIKKYAVALVLVGQFIQFLLVFGMSIPIINLATRRSFLKANFSMETSRTTSLRPAPDYHISAGFYFIPEALIAPSIQGNLT